MALFVTVELWTPETSKKYSVERALFCVPKKYCDSEQTHLSRSKGYVETMGGRRRYLPNIKAEGDEYQWVRGAAERQAVNTTVQGSAADLVKNAIVNIDKELRRTFQG